MSHAWPVGHRARFWRIWRTLGSLVLARNATTKWGRICVGVATTRPTTDATDGTTSGAIA